MNSNGSGGQDRFKEEEEAGRGGEEGKEKKTITQSNME